VFTLIFLFIYERSSARGTLLYNERYSRFNPFLFMHGGVARPPPRAENLRMTLIEALPELVYDVESALVRLGRGRVAEQVREAPLVSWTYDDFARTTYLAMRAATDPLEVAEVISLHEDIGVSLDLDAGGVVMGMAVEGYEDIMARLRGDP
jgi:hypothetical protein